ncbi:NRDE family protein [Pseudalkalibacillus caeni]|uniref:NRDE family protein n=1 Tax=Exobacillus caeni TaxID=2574798 RepID=A0A5R9F3D9_9BACL|nr:NRDE family protein [Pseudalkalibacillus caeni]TLS37541.1 NRDE family protein [Pseudalkalibacillus caeni]
MCLLSFAYQVHPDYPLILISNRDEVYHRPTARAHFWKDYPYVLAGRDLEKNGTWLGVTTSGRFSALTNYRKPGEIQKSTSRGDLVSGFLTGTQKISEYIACLEASADNYNGYNIIAGSLDDLWYFSNCSMQSQKVKPGIYGLSNHLLDTPWPKVRKIKSALSDYLASADPVTIDGLLQLLLDGEKPNDEDLPDTGVGLEWERILSPVFIKSERYGTRANTVILIDRIGNLSFYEKSFDSGKFFTSSYKIKLGNGNGVGESCVI